MGSGKWAAHWLGDNFSNWPNLRRSVIGMLQFNQFGIPMVGADICGFIGETEPELCARWHQLGAFYPFSRNHNTLGTRDQDPGALGGEVVAAARAALQVRYWLLPHLYTLLYLAAVEGGTVARPVWHEFPRDAAARTLDTQFLWGRGLLVSPVLEQAATNRSLYLPPAARWFSVGSWFHDRTWAEVAPGYTTVVCTTLTTSLHCWGVV